MIAAVVVLADFMLMTEVGTTHILLMQHIQIHLVITRVGLRGGQKHWINLQYRGREWKTVRFSDIHKKKKGQ